MDNFSTSHKLQRVENAAAAATTDITSDAFDARAFHEVTFVALFGSITAGAVTSMHVEGSNDGSTGWTDIAGTNQAVADDDDNKAIGITIRRPPFPYLRAIIDRGTQNAVLDGIVAIGSKPDSEPVIHDSATVVGFEFHDAPAAGTI